MPRSSSANLHGSAPDKSDCALLLIDVINAMNFPQGKQLLRYALPAAERIAALKARARKAKIPVIYVNDNFGRWRSDFNHQVQHCLQDNVPGKPVVELLLPGEEDYFVLKPKHSGFYSTCLDTLLGYLQVKRLILTGFAGNLCVLYTANDAYMRDYELVVPRDCIASETRPSNRYALEHMKKHLKASTPVSRRIIFSNQGRDDAESAHHTQPRR